MRVLVCGGRDFNDWDLFKDTMTELLPGNDYIIIHGCAKGADYMAQEWAKYRGCAYAGFPADWTQGKKAGILRNIQMLEEGKPDLVIAFPGGKGTAHMVKIAKEAQVQVIEINVESPLVDRPATGF